MRKWSRKCQKVRILLAKKPPPRKGRKIATAQQRVTGVKKVQPPAARQVKDIISVTEEDLLKLGEVDDSDPELPIIEPFAE